MRTLTTGQWYLMFVCENCKVRQVLFPDLSHGKSKINATYHVACVSCGHQGAYDSEAIERYQHQADGDKP